MQSEDFQAWFAASSDWLQPYAAFLFLKDLFGTSEHWRWGSLSQPSSETIARLNSSDRPYHASLQFIYYLQWHLHKQLLAAARYANSKHVVLKGDLPIGADSAWLVVDACAVAAPSMILSWLLRALLHAKQVQHECTAMHEQTEALCTCRHVCTLTFDWNTALFWQ